MFCFTKPGKAWNEDRGYVSDKFGFVLDGASSITKQKFSDMHTDAEWSSNWWHKYLQTALKNEEKFIPEILKDGIEKYVSDFKRFSKDSIIEDFPCTTVSIVRKINDNLEFYSLGNSPIIFKTKLGQVFTVVDPLNNVVDDIHAAIYKDLAVKENLSVVDVRKKYPQYIADGRFNNNKLGGYFILSNSIDAVDHGVYNFIPANLVKKTILMTDGYADIVDLMKDMTDEELINTINTPEDAERIYNRLCALQNSDAGGDKYIRFKLRDDATLVCMQL